jgi:putative membrane protein
MSMGEPRFDVQPSVGNHFAWMRTQLGLQRTLMASVRTAVSLIGFGFTVAQFFQRMQGEGAERFGVELPRNLGLALIAAGVLSLAVALWQYHLAMGYLRGSEFEAIAGPPTSRRSLHTSTYLAATVVLIIGVAAFGSVFLNF